MHTQKILNKKKGFRKKYLIFLLEINTEEKEVLTIWTNNTTKAFMSRVSSQGETV